MGLYVSFEDVRVRLIGKVRFTEDESDENKMSIKLAKKLIEEAESQVEMDLSPRYQTPFVTTDGAEFKNLPLNPTRNVIKTLCELVSVIRILETDFGSGTAIDGDKYIQKIQKRYDDIIENNILAKIYEEQKQYKFPPLPELKKNWFNTEADDGFPGMVLVSNDRTTTDNPAKQINDPAQSFWWGVLDD